MIDMKMHGNLLSTRFKVTIYKGDLVKSLIMSCGSERKSECLRVFYCPYENVWQPVVNNDKNHERSERPISTVTIFSC